MGKLVWRRIAERKRSPSARLPPASRVATQSLPTTKPTLAIAPSFDEVVSSSAPARMKRPGATSSKPVVAADLASAAMSEEKHPQLSAPSSAFRRDTSFGPVQITYATLHESTCGCHVHSASWPPLTSKS